MTKRTELKCRVRRCKWAIDSRERFPAGKYIGDRFAYCNHVGEDSFAIQITLILPDTKVSPAAIVMPWFPSCCFHLPWARALFFLASHRIIRDNIPYLSLRRNAFELLTKKAGTYGILMPHISSFWQIRNGRSLERAQRRQNAAGEQKRFQQVENFLKTVESKKLPKCFLSLGFERVPTLAELRERFLELARIHHPDVGGNARDFRFFREAYEEAVIYLKSN